MTHVYASVRAHAWQGKDLPPAQVRQIGKMTGLSKKDGPAERGQDGPSVITSKDGWERAELGQRSDFSRMVEWGIAMDWAKMEKHFSCARTGRYKKARQGNEVRAAADYSRNMLLAEAMMPMLNVLEIALRNALNGRLVQLYGREDWWVAWDGKPRFARLLKSIEDVKSKLAARKERVTPDKILAELTFGFWSSLFNAQLQAELWKSLRLAFPRCPKDQRKRHTVSAALNQVRDLRNRVFHHEPLLWLTPDLFEQHGRGVKVINWLDPQLGAWLRRHDRLAAIWRNGVDARSFGGTAKPESWTAVADLPGSARSRG